MATMAPPMAGDEPEDFRNNTPPFGDESNSKALVPAQTQALAAQGMALAGRGETASTAAAVQAKTQVEARYMMALRQPRSLFEFRQKLLAACERPRFAQTSRYAKPVGKEKVVGWSIRFAEECARCLGNLLVESAVIYDDSQIRLVRVMVTDLEANLTYPTDVTVSKTVERKFLKKGQQAIRTRVNTFGEPVHIVEATDDDILNKQNALVSKAIRTAVLRVVPGDILEEAEEKVAITASAEDAKDPAAKAKAIADAFYVLGVMPAQIEKVLGHSLANVTPAEVTMMRTWHTAMKDGETTWREIEEGFSDEGRAKGEATTGTAPATGTAGLRERVMGRKPPVDDTPAKALQDEG